MIQRDYYNNNNNTQKHCDRKQVTAFSKKILPLNVEHLQNHYWSGTSLFAK